MVKMVSVDKNRVLARLIFLNAGWIVPPKLLLMAGRTSEVSLNRFRMKIPKYELTNHV